MAKADSHISSLPINDCFKELSGNNKIFWSPVTFVHIRRCRYIPMTIVIFNVRIRAFSIRPIPERLKCWTKCCTLPLVTTSAESNPQIHELVFSQRNKVPIKDVNTLEDKIVSSGYYTAVFSLFLSRILVPNGGCNEIPFQDIQSVLIS